MAKTDFLFSFSLFSSDCVFQGWQEAGQGGNYAAYSFCQENFLSIKTLQELASMKRQFVELLSDIGFIQDQLTSRAIERKARNGVDGVLQATSPQVRLVMLVIGFVIIFKVEHSGI